MLNYWTCEYLPDWAMQDVIDIRVAVIDRAWFYEASEGGDSVPGGAKAKPEQR